MKAIFDSGETSMQSFPVRTTGCSDVNFGLEAQCDLPCLLARFLLNNHGPALEEYVVLHAMFLPPLLPQTSLLSRHEAAFVYKDRNGGCRSARNRASRTPQIPKMENNIRMTSCTLACLFHLSVSHVHRLLDQIRLTLLRLALVAIDNLVHLSVPCS